MAFVFILVVLILIFSLYQYVDNSQWEEFHDKNFKTIFAHRNKRYGAYQIRTRQPVILMYVLLAFVLLGVISVYAKTIVDNYEGLNSMTFSEVSDTTQFTLSNQNTQELPPEVFNYAGENGDGLPEAKDGGEKREDNPETDQPSSQPESQPKPEPKKKSSSPEQSIYDFEQELFAKEGGAAQREKIQKDMDQRKKEREEREKKKQQQKTEGGNGGNVGSNSGVQGKTLAEWNMNGRKPHQNNPDYIKIPGYMCGRGVNEKIVVKVKVNSNGDVYWAQSLAPEGANPCCVEQAITYAKKSRFEYAATPIQEGTITYYFKAQ